MEPLVLILVVLVFSILDAIGRKQRKDRGENAQVSSGPNDEVPEDVIVPEIWEEIRKLARAKSGTARGESVPGEPEAPVPVRVEPRERDRAVTRRPAKPPPPVHAVHRTHPKMGRPLSERRTPLDQPISEAARHRPSKEVTEVRRMLGQGVGALRRAVILDEVLGPPVALREDPDRFGG